MRKITKVAVWFLAVAVLSPAVGPINQALAVPPPNQDGGQFCYQFRRNLQIGNAGSDVRNLRQALRLEGFGITSSNEVKFDDFTADAVSGFQQKYASEVLTPNGLKYGTGTVGPSTRAKLNSLYSCGTSNTRSAGSATATSTSPNKKFVARCSYVTMPGCTLMKGPNYDAASNCGLVSSCPTATSTPATPSITPSSGPVGTRVTMTIPSWDTADYSYLNMGLQNKASSTLYYSYGGNYGGNEVSVNLAYKTLTVTIPQQFNHYPFTSVIPGVYRLQAVLRTYVNGQPKDVPYAADFTVTSSGGSDGGSSPTSTSISAKLMVTAASTTAPAKQIAMGSAGNSLVTFNFAETSGVEDLKVTQIIVYDAVSRDSPAGFRNVTLSCGNTDGPVATANANKYSSWSYRYYFNFSTPCVIPRNYSQLLVLRGDATPSTEAGVTGSNAEHKFQISYPGDITVLGVSSSKRPEVKMYRTVGNTQTILGSSAGDPSSAAVVDESTANTASILDAMRAQVEELIQILKGGL